jgi:polyhydroxyalkanoate synthesis regulator phasin
LYLDAEACWRRAQTLDATNPAYSDALIRLRRARPSPGRLDAVAGIAAIGILFGLLAWQHAALNASQARRIVGLEGGVERTGKAMATLDARFADQIKAVETALHEDIKHVVTSADLTTLSQRLDAKIDQVANAAASFDARVAGRIDSVATLLREETKDLAKSGELAALSRRLEAAIGGAASAAVPVETRLADQIRAVEKTLREDMKLLPQNSEISAIGQAIAELRQQVAGLASLIAEREAGGNSVRDPGER